MTETDPDPRRPSPNPSRADQKKAEQAARLTENRIFNRRNLAWKIFTFTFPFIFLIVLATQVGVAYMNYLGQLEAYRDRAELTADLTAEALSRPVWNLDRSVFTSQVQALANDNSFLHARLVDETGQVLFELGQKAQSSSIIEAVRPIQDPEGRQVIGRISLTISTAHLLTNAYRQALIGLGAILALLVGFFFILHRALRRLVKKPLDRLLQAMARVEKKDWQKVDWEGHDEIARVTGTFNRMVDSLRTGDEAQRLLAELEKAQAELIEKNDELAKANRLILESIQYARRIQTAMLPDKQALSGMMRDVSVFWEPLHLVGGDYFWLERFGSKCLLAVIDCTGHGVPGAFMTMVAASALDHILHDDRETSPANILKMLDRMVRARLRQDRPDSDSDDGLEAAVCVWDRETRILTFAGAGLPLIYQADGRVEVVRGQRDRLGYRSIPPRGEFTDARVETRPGMSFYLLTDGVPDHMGGSPPRLFGRKKLIRVLEKASGRSMAEQLDLIREELDDYRDDEPRRDDMTMIGFTPL